MNPFHLGSFTSNVFLNPSIPNIAGAAIRGLWKFRHLDFWIKTSKTSSYIWMTSIYMSLKKKTFWIYIFHQAFFLIFAESQQTKPHFAGIDSNELGVVKMGCGSRWLAVAWSHRFLKLTNFVLNDSISSGKPITYIIKCGHGNEKSKASKATSLKGSTGWKTDAYLIMIIMSFPATLWLFNVNSLLWKPWPIFDDLWMICRS